MSSWLPQLCRMLKRRLINLSHHPEYRIMSCILGNRKMLGKWQIVFSEGINNMQVLLTTSETPSRSPPGASGNTSPPHAHNRPMSTSSVQNTSFLNTPTPWSAFPIVAVRESFGGWLVNIHKELAQICSQKEIRDLNFGAIFGKTKKRLSAPSLEHSRIHKRHTSLRVLPQAGARGVEQV